jgi:hypothetical protein
LCLEIGGNDEFAVCCSLLDCPLSSQKVRICRFGLNFEIGLLSPCFVFSEEFVLFERWDRGCVPYADDFWADFELFELVYFLPEFGFWELYAWSFWEK